MAIPPSLLMPHDYADQRCGVKDPTAKFLEQVHFDCKECHAIVKKILLERKPPVQPKRRALQIPAPWMKEIDVEDGKEKA